MHIFRRSYMRDKTCVSLAANKTDYLLASIGDCLAPLGFFITLFLLNESDEKKSGKEGLRLFVCCCCADDAACYYYYHYNYYLQLLLVLHAYTLRRDENYSKSLYIESNYRFYLYCISFYY